MGAFDYFVSDQSPLVVYAPYRDGDPGGGWNATYSQSNITWTENTLGVGTSSHITTCPGVTASFNFTGTGITALGNANSVTSYNVSCDEGLTIPVTSGWQSGVLGSCMNMTFGDHTIKVTNTGEAVFSLNAFHAYTQLAGNGATNHSVQAAPAGSKRSLDTLDFQWYLPLEGETVDDVIGMVMAAQNSANDDVARKQVEKRIMKRSAGGDTETMRKRGNFGDGTWTTTGIWNVNSNIGGGGGSNSIWYPRVTSVAANSVMIITVPLNASFIALKGSVDWNHGIYEVQAWPNGQQSLASDWTVFNGSSRWASTDQILCTAVFDPTKSWQAAVTNLGADPYNNWDIAELFYVGTEASNSTSTNPNTTSSSSSLSSGAIAGIVVGSVLGVALVGVLAFLLWRRKKKNERPSIGPYRDPDLLDDKDRQPTPFVPPFPHTVSSDQSSEVPIMSPGRASAISKGGVQSSGTGTMSQLEEGYFQSQSNPETNSTTGSASGFSTQPLSSSAMPEISEIEPGPSKVSRSPRPAPPPRTFRQEQDAGRVAEDEIIPPTYNPAWADHNADTTTASTSMPTGSSR